MSRTFDEPSAPEPRLRGSSREYLWFAFVLQLLLLAASTRLVHPA